MRASHDWRLAMLAGLGGLILALSFGHAARAADADADLARKACQALRAAGLDPAREVQVRNVSAAVLSFPAQAAISKAGLNLEPVCYAIKAHPEVLTETVGATPPAASPKPPTPSKKSRGAPPDRPTTPLATSPPAAGSGADPGPADGFGAKAVGGDKEVRVNSFAQLASAVKQAGSRVVLAPGDYDNPSGITIGSNVTLDGGDATLWSPGTGHNAVGVNCFGTSIVLRNLHIRNAGDCIDFGNASWSRTSDVLVEHVTVSGSGDDGFSPSYGSKNITVRWSAAYGCTRAIFIKYGGATDITFHHTILSHYWMRGPLVEGAGARCDFRNNLVQHWQMWGSEPNGGSMANFVNGTWRFDKGVDLGKADCAIGTFGGKFYSSGNQFVGCSQRAGSAGAPVFEAPPINGQTDAATALTAVLDETTGAGCMPRDAIDKAYLALHQGWQAQPSNKGITHGLQVPETEAHLKGAK